MSESILLRGFLAAGVWTVEATALLVGAWLLTRLFRTQAPLRHLTWLTAFCALLLIPCLTRVVPALVVVRTSAPTTIGTLLRSPTARRWAHRINAPLFALERRPAAESSEDVRTVKPTPPRRYGTPIRLALLLLWIVGVVTVAIQIACAFCGIGLLRRRSVEIPFDAIDRAELAARVDLTRAWELRISSTPTPPVAMTWGAVRPVVLLPSDAVSWPQERLEAVLLHELAHVQRYDSVTQLLAFIVCALYWFHPAVWLAARAMRADAEAAADDAVLRSGIKPSTYASQLLWCAARSDGRQQPFARMGVSLTSSSKIESRILSIVDLSLHRRALTSLEALKAGGVGLIAMLLLASVRPAVSLAGVGQESLVSLKSTRLIAGLRHAMRSLVPITRLRAALKPSHLFRYSPVSRHNVRFRHSGTHQKLPGTRNGGPVSHNNITEYRQDRRGTAVQSNGPSAETGADTAAVLPYILDTRRLHPMGADLAAWQRAAATADSHRQSGNADGSGAANEAAARRREAAIRKAMPNPVAADRFIADADRAAALSRSAAATAYPRDGSRSSRSVDAGSK